jgi:putative membrane protein
MATVGGLRRRVRDRPALVTIVLSAVGYALVGGTFAGVLPFPTVSRGVVILLGDAIAAVNAAALLAIVLGYRAIRRGNVARHRVAMLTAFALIMIFLVMYLTKVGGGFEKAIMVEGPIYWAYLVMLAIHVLLSAVSVPVVLHAVVLGLSHAPDELGDTLHPRVGRIAVAAWSLSLALGFVTYVMLNHVYGWEPLLTVFDSPIGPF